MYVGSFHESAKKDVTSTGASGTSIGEATIAGALTQLSSIYGRSPQSTGRS